MKKTLLSLAFTISSLTSFAQTGIWATVENISNLQKDSTFQSLNLEVTQAFPSSKNPLLQNVFEFTTNNNIVSVSNILSTIKGISKIEFAPEYETLSLPNDISSTGYNYALDLINASAAWNLTTGDSTVIIGISDSNFDLDHEELINKSLYVSPNIYGTDYNHGTAVAAIASGNTNNAVGNSSIGYNTHMKFFGMSYNELLEATYNGCRVINASWAAGCAFNQYAQLVVDEVYGNGSILVAAAGNGSTCGGAGNLVYPAAFNHVISVSSVGPYDNHERFIGNSVSTHQHNSEVDICAPGYDVALTISNNIYITGNGTSFAAPYVSGTIALMLSVNPCLTFEAIEAILDSTATDIYSINSSYVGLLGSGRLNAGAAVNLALHWVVNIELNPQDILCNGMNNGSVESIVTGGMLPYSYEWNTGYSGKNLNNITAGVYSLTVTDGTGCTQTVSTEVTEPEVLEAAVKGINNWIDLAVAGGTPGYIFEWNNGSTTEDLHNIENGFYEVLVTDANGCMVSTNITFENEQLSVNENTIDELNVYPNPSTGNITIEFNDNIKEIKVVSITGQVIKVGNSTTALTNLNAGEYFIYYTNGVDIKVNKFTVI